MPGFDLSHLVMIVVVAILVIGPARLPEIGRRLSEFMVESRKANAQFAKAFREGMQGVEASDQADGVTTESDYSMWRDILFHAEAFRKALIISIVAILATTLLAYVFSDTLLSILRAPAGDIKLQAFSPLDGFIIRFRIALYGGVALAAPIWIYEIMRYLDPALFPHEKRLLIPGVIAMVVLFLLGNAFGYLMLRNMMGVMFSMFGSELNYLPSADQYISFVVYFLVATGISFELPIVLLILIKLGFVSPEFLRKQRKVAWFIIFVFAELITPVSDPIVAPTVVMIPMVMLFELALIVSRFLVPKRVAPTPEKKAA